MNKKIVGVTHQQFDFDGGSCLRLLERNDLIQEKVFGMEAVKEKLKKGDIKKLIFADIAPEEISEGPEVEIFDHHQAEDKEERRSTAFDILLSYKGTMGLEENKVKQWQKLVEMGDKKTENDDMDIARILKRLHLTMGDKEIYQKCFLPIFDAFFDNPPNLNRNLEIFRDKARQFIHKDPDMPGIDTVQRWIERMEDPEKLFKASPRNFCHYFIYLDSEQVGKWTSLVLEAVYNEQSMFLKDTRDFVESQVRIFGDIPVITSLNSSPTFLRAARYMIYSDKENSHPLLQSKIKNRNSPWILIKVDPETKNFQIFVNAGKKIGQAIFPEIIKALRAEILLRRGNKIPHWQELIKDGVLSGTEPLYYNKVETGFSNILWGSLKIPAPPAKDFGNTASKILERLAEIIRHAVDREYFPHGCTPGECKKCSIFQWQLKKCFFKRKNN